MDLLSFSADFGDEESNIAEKAEATLRSQYSQHTGRRSSDSLSTRMPAAVPFQPPKKRGRPLGSKNKPKSIDGAAPPRPAAPSLLHKRPADHSGDQEPKRRTPSGSHDRFVAPPTETKGAYRLEASHPSQDIDRSFDRMGISGEGERAEIRSIIERGVPELLSEKSGEESDTASFTRNYAVEFERMFSKGDCAICEETLVFSFHAHKNKIGPGVKAADRTLNAHQRQKERLLRAIQARSNLAEGDQRCHQVIYSIEQSLRGRVADKRLFKLMILLRREWIEKRLEYYQIPYVPWTMKMLEAHYNPRNKHFYQPTRELMVAHEQVLTLQDKLYEAAYNPAAGTFDYRGVQWHEKYVRAARETSEALRQHLDEASPDFAESMRMLATAIFSTTRDESALKLTQDPEMAAGKLKAGGGGEAEPHSSYAMQYLSAQ